MAHAQAEAVVAARISAWPSLLEEELFGTSDPAEIVRSLDDFCRSGLGERLDEIVFYRRGVGGVFGVTVGDGRRIVVKVHRLDLVPDGLDGVRLVQRHLADAGLPAPRPFGEPLPLGAGLAAAEEMLERGGPPSAHDPDVRRDLAEDLRWFVEAAAPLVGEIDLAPAHPFGLPPEVLWPQAHDLRFDISLPGGEWIDEVALAARSALKTPVGRPVIGHLDWRVENLRYEGSLAAIFDWDSVALCPEPALIGMNATGFTADWSDDDLDPYPSPGEATGFIAAYERARGASFTPDENAIVEAALLYRLAYSARCEHSDAALGLFPDLDPEHGWRSLLRTAASRV